MIISFLESFYSRTSQSRPPDISGSIGRFGSLHPKKLKPKKCLKSNFTRKKLQTQGELIKEIQKYVEIVCAERNEGKEDKTE